MTDIALETTKQYDLIINKDLPPALPIHKENHNVSQPLELFDHSHLKPGKDALLLSYAQTMEMYKQSAKKTNSLDMQYEFAMFMVEASKHDSEYLSQAEESLRHLSIKGHVSAQYELALLYTSGLSKGKPELEKAFTLFVQASKHLHTESALRVGQCYEQGLGCRSNGSKAIQFYKKAASQNHPHAMYKLGIAYMHGDMGLYKSSKEALKWFNRSVEASCPEAIYELAHLHTQGIPHVLFIDIPYAVSLFDQAAALGHAPSAFCLGQCYQNGTLECQPDPALSIHYYTIAAEKDHSASCFALAGWYLEGYDSLLPQSNEKAYLWAKRAAEMKYAKAEYVLGYFLENGIGCKENTIESNMWYHNAAKHGDLEAIKKIQGEATTAIPNEKKKDCCIM